MAKFSNDENPDAYLNNIKNNADEQALCSQLPATYYEGCDPPAWEDTTVYNIGDAVRPATRAGYAYECTTGGTSGGSEPSFGTTPTGTTNDNGVVWTCRNNYALVSGSLAPTDFTGPVNGDVSGRKITLTAKNALAVIFSGDVSHSILLDGTNKKRMFVTTTTILALTVGGQANIPAWKIETRDPT